MVTETVWLTAIGALFGLGVLAFILLACWLAGRRQSVLDEIEERRKPRLQSTEYPVWVHWSIETEYRDKPSENKPVVETESEKQDETTFSFRNKSTPGVKKPTVRVAPWKSKPSMALSGFSRPAKTTTRNK